jgi:peroxiredoxin
MLNALNVQNKVSPSIQRGKIAANTMAQVITRLRIGDQAPNLNLLDQQNRPVALADFWRQGPVFLNFIRHFGCIFCREWLAELDEYESEFRAGGLQVLAIAQGKPRHAERYCGALAPGVSCLMDEGTQPYYAYGLQRGNISELASFQVAKATLRALSKGARVGKTIGDPTMMPGMFLIDQQGRIRYTYYSQHAGDHPRIASILAAAETL